MMACKILFILVIVVVASSCLAFQLPISTTTCTSNYRTKNTNTELRQDTELQMQFKQSNDAPPLKRNPPRKVLLMVEPTPFTHVSGYANRFKEMLKFLSKAGDDVEVLTCDSKTPYKDLPKESFGYKIHHTLGFTFPLYNQISLTLDLPEMKGAQIMDSLKPDLIHVTSP
jgi:sulfoquinovosyltransferase